jgi:hypothetical protein
MPPILRRRVPLALGVALLLLSAPRLGAQAVSPKPPSQGGPVSPKPSGEGGNDLDAFMERVLARRDESWKKLQQYVLEEKESFDVTGPGGMPLYGLRRDYSWFIKEGFFVRSPVRADGVALSEADRRKAEAEWIRKEQRRDARRKRREVRLGTSGVQVTTSEPAPQDAETPATAEDVLKQGVEPQFVSLAYFMRFRFEAGRYALVGREKIDDRPVLRIEYYPQNELFREGRSRPNRRARDEDDQIEERMNKVSLITLWVDPETHQILQYTFDDIDMDFLPGRSLARVDDVKASMRMFQAFPSIWLPRGIDMHFRMTIALGSFDASYRVEYRDYKEANVTVKIK